MSLPLPPLKLSVQKLIQPAIASEEKREQNERIRAEFLSSMFQYGGKRFVEFCRNYGCTEREAPVDFTNWFLEYIEAIGHFGIHETYTTGPSQIGKTLPHTWLACFTIIEVKLNLYWAYDKRESRDRSVPLQFRPIVQNVFRKKGVKPVVGDTQNNSLYQTDGGNVFFGYASTSKPSLNEGRAIVGSVAASVTADVLVLEERSQYPPGAEAPFPRRLDASLIPTKPKRELGTPGGGLGIEKEIQRCDRHFYPHVDCPHCGKTVPLDPKGCMLKQADIQDATGRMKKSFLSESGRPILKTVNGQSVAYWHHRDPNQAIATAYIGCSACGKELSEEIRVNAYFKCLKTGALLRSFLDAMPKTVPTEKHKVAIHLTPLVRKSQINLAAELIRGGLDASNPTDWQQQGLGHPSESGNTSVPLSLLQSLIGAPRPTRVSPFTLAGADQGRGEDWLWIVNFYPPNGWQKMPVAEVVDRTIREVVFGGDIVRSQIPDTLKRFDVSYGLFDNEPDRSDISNKICRKTVMEMADQRPDLADAAVMGTVDDGGIEYPCWKIRNEKFLKQVLTSFFTVSDEDGYSLYRLPASWDKWMGVDKSERSPLTHLSGPSYDPETGRWKRGEGNIDDLYYAAMFCEAAFYLYLVKNRRKGQADWWKNI